MVQENTPEREEDIQERPERFWTFNVARELTKEIVDTYQDQKGINHIEGVDIPQRSAVLSALDSLLEVIFPGYTGKHNFDPACVEFVIGYYLDHVYRLLTEQVKKACVYADVKNDAEQCAEEVVLELFRKMPAIREALKNDAQAAFDGDPAAQSIDEIVIAYPGLKAIAIHRIAHELYSAGVPLIPRVMSEYAHTLTGIDIHPGARIGQSFFIDHGTGVVIGETAVIGANVKLYQGVTLGAMSFPKDERGKLIKGKKRHPDIGDNVTIYSGATILGGITIGHDSVIGGNVWITENIEPCSKVTIPAPDLKIKQRRDK